MEDGPLVTFKRFRWSSFFLGIEVIRHDNDILLSQHNYLQYLMAKTLMDGVESVKTLLPSNL